MEVPAIEVDLFAVGSDGDARVGCGDRGPSPSTTVGEQTGETVKDSLTARKPRASLTDSWTDSWTDSGTDSGRVVVTESLRMGSSLVFALCLAHAGSCAIPFIAANAKHKVAPAVESKRLSSSLPFNNP